MREPESGPALVRHPVHPHLDGLVAGIVGFRERADAPVIRRQQAGSLIPMILCFGAALDVTALSDGSGVGRHDSFIAGFMPGHATTSFVGEQHCLQVYFTPLGVQVLLGVPGLDLSRRVVTVADSVPYFGDGLLDRLSSAPTWGKRFTLIERALLARRGRGLGADPFVVWMWQQIQHSGGRARIGELMAQTGWSERHVTSRFREQIGLTPKLASSVVRFERASTALRSLAPAEVAAVYGYADQSHLVRDVRRFAGLTPTELKRTQPATAHSAIGLRP